MYFFGEMLSFFVITIPVLLIAVLCFFSWKEIGRWLAPIVGIEVLLLIFSIWVEDTQGFTLVEAPWLEQFIKLAAHVAVPSLAVVLAARLVDVRHPQSERISWLRVALSALGFVLLLVLLGVQVALGSVWDVATDGLNGTFLVLLTNVGALAGAILLGWHLPRWWKIAGLAFMVIVVASMNSAARRGTIDPDGGWGQLPHLVTESRAKRIEVAIQSYRAAHGNYPEALAELSPRYMVYVPNPIMVKGKSWCYDSGASFYRLGAIYREYFSSPESVKIYATEGEIPETELNCP